MKALDLSRFPLYAAMTVALLSGCGQPLASGAVPDRDQALSPRLESSVYRAGGVYKTLFSFNGKNGSNPEGLIPVDGVLYGLTYSGGANNAGTAFTLSSSGKEKVLHNFGAGTDGSKPEGALILVKGDYYGTTFQGGTKYQGTVFSLKSSGKERLLYSFTGIPDGAAPGGSLTDVQGTLYGTTAYGGAAGCYVGSFTGCGTVFKITTGGKERVLHQFQGSNDGRLPNAPLIKSGSDFYGTANQGGAYNYGTLFKVTTSGSETTLLSFGVPSSPHGSAPVAPPTLLSNGIYGTTSLGGKDNDGIVYKASKSGKEHVLHAFAGNDGKWPYAGLVALGGNLYGTTAFDGKYGGGTLFKVSPSGKVQVLYDFGANAKDGKTPEVAMVVMNGSLYGTAGLGGKYNDGTVFEYTP